MHTTMVTYPHEGLEMRRLRKPLVHVIDDGWKVIDVFFVQGKSLSLLIK